jgi:hypothetical protein
MPPATYHWYTLTDPPGAILAAYQARTGQPPSVVLCHPADLPALQQTTPLARIRLPGEPIPLPGTLLIN